jgi:hypothetical protein
MSLLTLFLLTGSWAASFLDPTANYPVEKSADVAVSAKALVDQRSETRISYESFSSKERIGVPMMTSETTQTIELRKKESKDPKVQRMAMEFQQYRVVSRMQIPGAKKPFITDQDFGSVLANRPILVKREAGKPDEFENVEAIKRAAESSTGDLTMRKGLAALLTGEPLKAAVSSVGEQHLCVEKSAGKKPGDKWEISRKVDGTTLPFTCEFAGWSEASEKKIMVYRFTMPKQKVSRAQPNGVVGETETETKGTVYLEPVSGEASVSTETDVFAHPGEKETAEFIRLKKDIPVNRTIVRTWNHTTPI